MLMRKKIFLAVAISAAAVSLFFTANFIRAASSPGMALTGRVSSEEEGAMEGVLVSARKAGSTITVTVVSDEKGRYRFPASKLSPGKYSLGVRAAGFELPAFSIEVSAAREAKADLKLKKTANLASQLSNGEW